jgi:hypothetical protein
LALRLSGPEQPSLSFSGREASPTYTTSSVGIKIRFMVVPDLFSASPSLNKPGAADSSNTAPLRISDILSSLLLITEQPARSCGWWYRSLSKHPLNQTHPEENHQILGCSKGFGTFSKGDLGCIPRRGRLFHPITSLLHKVGFAFMPFILEQCTPIILLHMGGRLALRQSFFSSSSS